MKNSSPPTSRRTWLPTNAKAGAELQHEALQVLEETALELAFPHIVCESQKVEGVGGPSVPRGRDPSPGPATCGRSSSLRPPGAR